MGVDWQKLLIAAGGAAGVAAVLYFLLQEDPELDEKLSAAREERAKAAAVAAAADASASASGAAASGSAATAGSDGKTLDIVQLLTVLVAQKDKKKTNMKTLVEELVKEPLPLERLVDRVGTFVNGQDPFEKLEKDYGVTSEQLEQLITQNQSNPEVMRLTMKVMDVDGSHTDGPPGQPSASVKAITVERIIEVHKYMLQQLKAFIKDVQSRPERSQWDMKTMVFASQAQLDAKVRAKYDIDSEDMNKAIMLKQQDLASNRRFVEVHQEIATTMEKLNTLLQ